MNRRQASHSTLLLIELIIAILFFSLASAICVQMFVHAHTLSEETKNKNQAVRLCETIAEVFYVAPSADDDTLYYDKNWESCTEEEKVYTIQLDITEAGTMHTCDITVTDSSGVIYSLQVQKHLGGDRS